MKKTHKVKGFFERLTKLTHSENIMKKREEAQVNIRNRKKSDYRCCIF